MRFKRGDIIGFVDESSQQLNANTQRVWSFKKLRRRKLSAHIRANSIGCYMLNGTDVIMFPTRTRCGEFCNFLEEVRRLNPIRRICLIIDNYSVHKSKMVRKMVGKLNIRLIYLPPYSPDLNPIEFIWKSIKRAISVHFVGSMDEMQRVITTAWNDAVQHRSFAKRWIQRFAEAVISYKSICA